MVRNKNVESSSKFKGHRHLSWATNDTRRMDSRCIKNTLHPKTSHKEHLAIDKDEIKLWSKMPNSKNIELRSQNK